MPKLEPDQEKLRQDQESRINRQIAFASGLFQGDVTIRTLLESLAEGVVIIDNSGTILLVNHHAEKIFDYPSGALIGKPLSVLVPEHLRKVHEEHVMHFFEKPRIRPMDQLPSLVGLHRDGSGFPLEISLSFIETINGVLALAFVNDTTSRKLLESQLRENEELFHVQVEGIKDYAIFMLDTQGNILNWNPGAERLKGYSAEEIIGNHFSCFYSEEDRMAGIPENELKVAVAEGQVVAEGWRFRKDGSKFWAEVIISALHNGDGSLRGFSKVTHDITGRKKVEDALRFSEDRYRALFEDNPTMIFTLDAAWTILSANPFGASQLGYTIDELKGRSVLKLFHADDQAAVAEKLLRCLEDPNQVHRWLLRKVRKDGTILWVEETAQSVYDLNNSLNILMVCLDITERKRAEEALRESETRFHAIFDLAAVGIAQVSLNGRWMLMNQKLSDILGYRFDELENMTLPQISHPEDMEPHLAHIRRLLAGEVPAYTMEKRYLCKDGSFLWVNLNVTLVRDQYGEPEYFIAIVEDINARKYAEEEIQKLNTSLQERTAELEDANKELEAFNYTVAHDLRQPLNIINSYCQVLEQLCGEQLQEDCMDYVREAYNGTLKMNRLIDTLLNFSRLGRIELRRNMVDFSMLAHEVAKSLIPTEPERQVDFRITDGIVANGASDLLKAVLENLLGNAYKYTGLCDKAVIEFGVKDIDGMPTYFVRDNGAGFDMAETAKLFTPFQRLSGAKNQIGFGIGLATVERIIKRHGGKVWAEGEPGKGACIYFTLPAEQVSN